MRGLSLLLVVLLLASCASDKEAALDRSVVLGDMMRSSFPERSSDRFDEFGLFR